MKEKEKHTTTVSSKLNDRQVLWLDTMIKEIGLKGRSEAIQYLINRCLILT